MSRIKNNLIFVLAVLLFFSNINCGGSTGTSLEEGSVGGGTDGTPQAGSPRPDQSSPENDSSGYVSKYQTSWHNLFNSKHYGGYLAMKFKGETGARLRDGRLISATKQNEPELNKAAQLISDHNAVIERGMDLSEEIIEAALEKAKSEGKTLTDWNLYYTIKIESPGHAEELYKELAETGIVEWIHPIPVPDVGDIGDVPDMGSSQLYLETETETGGLNIRAAWIAGITGQGVRIFDGEFNWNTDHVDLPIDSDDIYASSDPIYPRDFNLEDERFINHGTAVAGTLVGMNNGNGITGIAHSATLKLYRTDISKWEMISLVAGMLNSYVHGGSTTEPLMRYGDIILLETVSPGPRTSAVSGCQIAEPAEEDPTYCVPEEAYPLMFNAIQNVTELGLVVVEGAGNGGISLDDPEARATQCGLVLCPDLAVEDSGAIMVAASNGLNNNSKPWWSNWGNRINVYAWGYGVATTGYGNHPDSPDDENEWYTGSFNGTSSAAALVAGAVALAQSYTKELYKEIIPHKAVYLDAAQMRALIEEAGIPGNSPGMGKKPDVGAMMDLIESGVVIPHVTVDNEALAPRRLAVAGVRNDMDGDSRAELISFDGDLWKIDFSTVAPDTGCAGNLPDGTCDNYGDWDIQINLPLDDTSDTAIFYPAVHDYDSDGDADLAVYDSKNGKWYIKYTISEMVTPPFEEGGPGGIFLSWDLITDYSSDPSWQPYGRPMPGDYNGDNFLDLAVVVDGHWLIDYGGIGHAELDRGEIAYVSDFGEFEEDVNFIASRPADVPAWAYLPAVLTTGGSSTEPLSEIVFKTPDGIPGTLKMNVISSTDFSSLDSYDDHYYGDNEVSIVPYNNADGRSFSSWLYSYGFGDDWNITRSMFYYLISMPSPSWEGSGQCFPVTGDYDGDGGSDFGLKCPDNWKIAYYSVVGSYPPVFTLEEERIVDIDDSRTSLPPTVYPGGMNYRDIRSILQHYGLWSTYQHRDPFTPHTVQCIRNWGVPAPQCLSQ